MISCYFPIDFTPVSRPSCPVPSPSPCHTPHRLPETPRPSCLSSWYSVSDAVSLPHQPLQRWGVRVQPSPPVHTCSIMLTHTRTHMHDTLSRAHTRSSVCLCCWRSCLPILCLQKWTLSSLWSAVLCQPSVTAIILPSPSALPSLLPSLPPPLPPPLPPSLSPSPPSLSSLPPSLPPLCEGDGYGGVWP